MFARVWPGFRSAGKPQSGELRAASNGKPADSLRASFARRQSAGDGLRVVDYHTQSVEAWKWKSGPNFPLSHFPTLQLALLCPASSWPYISCVILSPAPDCRLRVGAPRASPAALLFTRWPRAARQWPVANQGLEIGRRKWPRLERLRLAWAVDYSL